MPEKSHSFAFVNARHAPPIRDAGCTLVGVADGIKDFAPLDDSKRQ